MRLSTNTEKRILSSRVDLLYFTFFPEKIVSIKTIDNAKVLTCNFMASETMVSSWWTRLMRTRMRIRVTKSSFARKIILKHFCAKVC